MFTLQTLPACVESFDYGVAKGGGFSLHTGVTARAGQGQKLEQLCRYDVQGSTSVAGGRKPGATISLQAISERRLSLTPSGNVRYWLKTPYRNGTTHLIFGPQQRGHGGGWPGNRPGGGKRAGAALFGKNPGP